MDGNKIKNFICILAFLVPYAKVNGQGLYLTPDTISHLGISYQGGIGSQNLQWAFISAFNTGETLNRDVRKKALTQTDLRDNQIGTYSIGKVYYRQKLGKGQLYLGLHAYQFIDANYSKDLFELTFFGNKSFEEKTAQMHPFYLKESSFLRYTLGWQKHWEGGIWGVKVGLVQGLTYNRIETSKASLYTAKNGAHLDLILDLEHEQAQANNNWKGTGVSADLFFQFNLGSKTHLQLNIENAGYIQWSKESVRRLVDSSYHYEGIALGNLLDSTFINLKSFEDIKREWLKEKKADNIQGKLPLIASMKLEYELTKKTYIYLHGQIISLESFSPRVGLGLIQKIGHGSLIGLQANTGGFTKFDAGLFLEQKLFLGLRLAANASISFDQISNKGLGIYGGTGVYMSL